MLFRSTNESAPALNIIQPAITDLLEGLKLPEKSAELETKELKESSGGSKWQVKQLNGRHHLIMRMILEGATYNEIAATVGMSIQAVMLVANSAIFKEELTKLEAEADWNVIRRADELSNEALSKLRDLMRRARSEALQASSAEKVLGIAGYSKIEKKQIAVVSGEDVIRELNRRRRERAFQADNSEGDPRAGNSTDVELVSDAASGI